MRDYDILISQLDDADAQIRLNAVRGLKALAQEGAISVPAPRGDTNSHIHTKYSFSPYYPAKAAYLAFESGLETAGIIDHDTVAGVPEFLEAAAILGLPACSGFEVRCDMAHTPFEGVRLNNPDQAGNAYITLQGLAHDKINYINEALWPYREERLKRTRKMADGVTALLARLGIDYDFERDVFPLTMFAKGGEITERHLLYALAVMLIKSAGKGAPLVAHVENELKIAVTGAARERLLDESNPHYVYDLLGLFKAELLDKVYVPGGADCPPLSAMRALAGETGAIMAYCYLGDQGNSVTGDKKAAKYEDGNLDWILSTARDLGFRAVAYMPSRNTDEQIKRLKETCAKYSLFEICGEDINQPRQKFICEKMRAPLYADAYDCTYALIGHELMVTKCGPQAGLFGDESAPLKKRVERFKEIGLKAYGK